MTRWRMSDEHAPSAGSALAFLGIGRRSARLMAAIILKDQSTAGQIVGSPEQEYSVSMVV